jgi:hypothetical protein
MKRKNMEYENMNQKNLIKPRFNSKKTQEPQRTRFNSIIPIGFCNDILLGSKYVGAKLDKFKYLISALVQSSGSMYGK